MSTSFDDAILRELHNRIELLQDALCHGQAKDFSEYKYMVGELRGLALAVGVTKDLAAHLRNDDD
jgi:hypothetical protein